MQFAVHHFDTLAFLYDKFSSLLREKIFGLEWILLGNDKSGRLEILMRSA